MSALTARATRVGHELTMDPDKVEEARVVILDLCERIDTLEALVNSPETEDFDKAVPLEAAHQVERWGTAHDQGKGHEDWFWVVGYLAGKALRSAISGDFTKAKHHAITVAAICRNWHAALVREEAKGR